MKQTQAEVTKDKNNKHPFHKKQQFAVSNENGKKKPAKEISVKLNPELALKIANFQAKQLKGNILTEEYECTQKEGRKCYPTFCTTAFNTDGKCMEGRKKLDKGSVEKK